MKLRLNNDVPSALYEVFVALTLAGDEDGAEGRNDDDGRHPHQLNVHTAAKN
jgi:hypothetical protein